MRNRSNFSTLKLCNTINHGWIVSAKPPARDKASELIVVKERKIQRHPSLNCSVYEFYSRTPCRSPTMSVMASNEDKTASQSAAEEIIRRALNFQRSKGGWP